MLLFVNVSSCVLWVSLCVLGGRCVFWCDCLCVLFEIAVVMLYVCVSRCVSMCLCVCVLVCVCVCVFDL